MSTRNRVRLMFHFGNINGGSIDKLLAVWVIYLVITGRKSIVIMFRIVGFVSIGKF